MSAARVMSLESSGSTGARASSAILSSTSAKISSPRWARRQSALAASTSQNDGAASGLPSRSSAARVAPLFLYDPFEGDGRVDDRRHRESRSCRTNSAESTLMRPAVAARNCAARAAKSPAGRSALENRSVLRFGRAMMRRLPALWRFNHGVVDLPHEKLRHCSPPDAITGKHHHLSHSIDIQSNIVE